MMQDFYMYICFMGFKVFSKAYFWLIFMATVTF